MTLRIIKALVCVISAEADNTNRGLDNSQYHAITSFNKCFISHWYHYLNSTGCERAQPIICRYDVTST